MAKVIVAAVAVGAVALIGIIGVLMYFSYSNAEVRLRNQITAKQRANTAVFDTCWKIIQQQCQISNQYKDGFKEIYTGLMEGRHYEKGGALMKFITEANPSFDVKLYEKVANSIEGQRMSFLRAQEELIDLKREHDNVRTLFPGCIFVGGRPEIDIKIVTSTKTDETFNTGKEDDVSLPGSGSQRAEK
jgi:hypothetical protein